MITREYPEISDSASYVYKVSAEEHFRQQCAAREDAIRRENTLKFGLEAAEKEIAARDKEIACLHDENTDLKDEINNLKDMITQLKVQLSEVTNNTLTKSSSDHPVE